MNYHLPKKVIEVMQRLQTSSYKAYIVGGAVRDLILNRAINDWDFTTNAKPEEILKIFPEGFYDNKFGTVGVQQSAISNQLSDNELESDDRRLMTDDSIFEITTMRKEGLYKDFRRPSIISWTDVIEEDLARREITINAMAMNLEGKIIDPFLGLNDLKSKTIKAVGNPQDRFKEDALRLMRAIRLATQLEFEIEKNTWSGILENAQLIKQISPERIRDEFFKILSSPNPYIGIKLLREAGILKIILPELERTFGIVQAGPKHARVYDIGEHSLLTLKETPSSDIITRLSALLHDIGKPDTMQVEKNGNVTFYNHDLVGGKLSLDIAKRLHLSKKQTDKLYRLVRWHLYSVNENQTDSAIRRFIKNIGLENVEDMLALRIGDRLGGGTEKAVSWRMEKFKERINQVLQKPFTVQDLKVNGKDVMEILKLTPGPKVGEILNKLFEEVLEDASKNNRDFLLTRIKQLE